MKKRIAAVGMMFAAVCGTTTVHAADGWYAGASVGRADNRFSTSIPLNVDDDDNPVPMSEKTQATAYKLFGGYQFNKNWAAEFEYIDFGKYQFSSAGPSGSAFDVKTSALAASVVGTWSFNDTFSVLGKFGLASKHTQADGVLGGSRTTVLPLIGVGAEYQLTQQLSLRAEYEYLGNTEVTNGTDMFKIKNNLVSIGARYRF